MVSGLEILVEAALEIVKREPIDSDAARAAWMALSVHAADTPFEPLADSLQSAVDVCDVEALRLGLLDLQPLVVAEPELSIR